MSDFEDRCCCEICRLTREVERLRNDLDGVGGYVEAVCDEGHAVLIDDGDGGVHKCPVCLGEDWQRKANDEQWKRICLIGDLLRLCRGWEGNAHGNFTDEGDAARGFAADLRRAIRADLRYGKVSDPVDLNTQAEAVRTEFEDDDRPYPTCPTCRDVLRAISEDEDSPRECPRHGRPS